jgi:hypothetical protein
MNINNENYFIILFVLVFAGIAIILPTIIDYLIDIYSRRIARAKAREKFNPKPKKGSESREEFYSNEFGSETIYDASEDITDAKEQTEVKEQDDSYESSIYICPECGSTELRRSGIRKISCFNCGANFYIDGNSNQSFK